MNPIKPFNIATSLMPWGTETLVAWGPGYIGKVLRYSAGKAGGLQSHRQKDETFYLHEGEAWVDYDPGDGTLARVRMAAGMSFHIQPSTPHRFTAITDCVVFEASTPHFDDRVRLEAEYGEPDTGGLPTTEPTA